MVGTDSGATNTFRVVDQIQLLDMHIQAFGYFGLQGVVNADQVLQNPLKVSAPTHLSCGDAIEIQNLYNRVRSDMIYDKYMVVL